MSFVAERKSLNSAGNNVPHRDSSSDPLAFPLVFRQILNLHNTRLRIETERTAELSDGLLFFLEREPLRPARRLREVLTQRNQCTRRRLQCEYPRSLSVIDDPCMFRQNVSHFPYGYEFLLLSIAILLSLSCPFLNPYYVYMQPQ
ncbi:hypothetical protein JAAARDRAFT_500888 [Jaapia argillacea MUCL 33604]|uniref:Uncharacterized protein n=1 Tax=Jaapia argillacea MUCL 33604 TaxID=933084 RepID=A0A067PCT9_9AGAM|nr:hypothetical protein JAAARDRAFT_500888 [Jaapia argillacea MUCL 33604]